MKFSNRIKDSWPNGLMQSDPGRTVSFHVKHNPKLSSLGEALAEEVRSIGTDVGNAVESLTNSDFGDFGQTPDSQDKTFMETVYSFSLPVPNEFTDTQTHNWETEEGIIGQTLGNVFKSEIAGGLSIDTVMGKVSNMTGIRKPLIDPGYFQNYKGTEPREFTFSWDLIPNSREEADNILRILKNLKKYTLPESSVNHVLLLSPYSFEINFQNTIYNEIINMADVVCSSMNITYSAEGTVQLLPDGMPKYIRLEMTFMERKTITADEYKDSEESL